ncbi:MAG TPA: hypothetical protein H9966_04905 [Candidatus Prevotella avicola]|uniref:Uncharacterized protein n=1 Tax=Candidatus Prevotella avicola TaxID=2838738 RepID=A0A9D2FYM5_9BACT|nr:hypothetical protein [Candidatus Prevotella avicola]
MALVSRAMAVSWREITQNNAHGKIISVALNLFKLVMPLWIHLSKAGGNGALLPCGRVFAPQMHAFCRRLSCFSLLFIIFVVEILKLK